jgi:preprotein translocase subunit SecA
VLNAKNHEREAEIIAQAGQKGAVTIATNMAGRGTDIVLGEGVAELGGLHVIGTERHESRRIDNQLRGRSGRQGDPGSSRFFLSLNDDLMRRFGAENLEGMLNKLPDDEPIRGKLFTKAVANAQRKVEANNFDARRWVLQYDDVLNQQREIIYKQRREVLTGRDLKDVVLGMAKSTIERVVKAHTADDLEEEWDFDAILDFVESNLLPEGRISIDELEKLDPEEMIEYIYDEVVRYYEERKEEMGEERLNEFAKVVTLRTVDRKWMDHIDAMEQLRQGIHLRAYGQDNPLRAYQFEGFAMFEEMVSEIQEEVVRYVMKSVIDEKEEIEREEVAVNTKAVSGQEQSGTVSKKQPVRRSEKVGRNDPCPCGSGKKYKNCCLKNEKSVSVQ